LEVYDWIQKGKAKVAGTAGRDSILAMEFVREETIVVCGVKIMALISLMGNKIAVQKGIGWNKDKLTA